jgi:copper transport protein
MRFVAILAAIFAVLAGSNAACAHASLVRSDPADGVVVAQPPPKVTLTFNEPVSPLALRLVAPGGAVVDLKDIEARGATVAVALPAGLARGTHLLSWRVISADGHPVGGALTFSIGQPIGAPPPVGQDTGTGWRAATWFARLALYLGLFVGVGGAFYGRWIARSFPSRGAMAAIRVALLGGLAAAVLSAGLQGVDMLSVSLSELGGRQVWQSGLTSAYGLTLGLAAAALALGLAANLLSGPIARWCSALALAGVGFALAASGHAATAGPELITRPAVFLHGVAVAFWVGALLPLGAALRRGDGRAELLRFSKAIPVPLVVLVATGIVLAAVQLERFDALWTTAYGLTLFRKLVAVCILLAFAAVNRLLTPRVAAGNATAGRWMFRSIQVELAIVVVILGLVASWRFTPPPRSLFAAETQPVHVHIHTEKAMADLRIEPPGPAGRRITIGVLDGEFRPLGAKEVELVLSQPAAGIEPLRLAAVRDGPTDWRVDGVRAPLRGRWHVRVNILVSDFEKITIEDDFELR